MYEITVEDNGWESFRHIRTISIWDMRRIVAESGSEEARAERQDWDTKDQFASYHCSSVRFVLDVIAKGVGSAVERARGRAKQEHSLKSRLKGLSEWER